MNLKLHLSHPLQTGLISFRYTNWKDQEHAYSVKVESIEFAPYTKQGMRSFDDRGVPVQASWVLNAFVLYRDSESRDHVRRTFLMSDMIDVAEYDGRNLSV